MPKYRFTTDDGKSAERAEEDVDLPDDKSAADEAQKALADIAKDQLPNGSAADFSAKVEDAAGSEIYRASLKFRGQTAGEAQTERENVDRAADEAAEAVARSLNARS